jgi:hypothetical protein
LKPLNEKQRQCARLRVKGHRNLDIAKQLGVNKGTITRWVALPTFQKELSRLSALADDSIMDGAIHKRLASSASEAVQALIDILQDERDDAKILKLKLSAATEILSRAGFAPVQRMDVRKQTTTATVSSDQIAELKSRLKLVNVSHSTEPPGVTQLPKME